MQSQNRPLEEAEVFSRQSYKEIKIKSFVKTGKTRMSQIKLMRR